MVSYSIYSQNNVEYKFNERKYDSIVKVLNYKQGDKVIVYSQFKINKNGETEEILVRGSHKIFEDKTKYLIKNFHQFYPNKLKEKPMNTKIEMVFTLVIETEKEEIKR